MGERRVGRPERPVDPSAGPVAAFAYDLRRLRHAAGEPSYRELARRAHFAASVLSHAAAGTALPSLRVTRGFVAACGGDPDAWAARWRGVAATTRGTQPDPGRPEDRRAVPEASEPGVPAQLPPPPVEYVGRDAELCALRLVDAKDPPSEPATIVLCGPIGVGKTALALHAATVTARRYPDGVLYADVSALAGDGGPGLLAWFLRALGVPTDQVPDGADHRSGLFRSILARRRVLVVLDGAASERQLRPLVIGGARSRMLITSRSRLPGLDGVRRLRVPRLTPAQSRRLLASQAPAALGGPDVGAADVLAELCGHLPLALVLAAQTCLDGDLSAAVQRAARPTLPGWLASGDVALRDLVRAAFRRLRPASRRALRRMAEAGLAEFTVDKAAPLLDLSPAAAATVLAELIDAGLLTVAGEDCHYLLPAPFAAVLSR